MTVPWYTPGYAPAQAQIILKDFAVRWMASIEGMHREVTKQFADGQCGRDVLQVTHLRLPWGCYFSSPTLLGRTLSLCTAEILPLAHPLLINPPHLR
jgi:hypothetical protein